MWQLSALAAGISLAAGAVLCYRLFARRARHPGRRTGMLVSAILLTIVQTGLAVEAAIADCSGQRHSLGWLFLLPVWCVLGAIAGALAALSSPQPGRRDAGGAGAVVLWLAAFGVGCCYSRLL